MLRPQITLGVILRWLLICSVVVTFVVYIVWQSRVFITGPVITVTTTPPTITSSTTALVAGMAENIVWIRINDRDIVTTPEGDFKEYVPLESGYTIIELSAADRFGRETTLLYPVVYQATSTASTTLISN